MRKVGDLLPKSKCTTSAPSIATPLESQFSPHSVWAMSSADGNRLVPYAWACVCEVRFKLVVVIICREEEEGEQCSLSFVQFCGQYHEN